MPEYGDRGDNSSYENRGFPGSTSNAAERTRTSTWFPKLDPKWDGNTPWRYASAFTIAPGGFGTQLVLPDATHIRACCRVTVALRSHTSRPGAASV